ncbi:octanoyltransferase LipM [mine drainage metagenome]|uniref:Octanoyltransferase LipM n=1 Tax=mine drainage metagenome TaxID=410659 RepID=A0A1J5RWP6_9ZZZZ
MTSAVLQTVSAADEQAWNERALREPLTTPAWRLWTYVQPAVVLGLSQRGLPLQGGGPDAAPPVIVRGSGGGAVLVGPWMLSISVVLPALHPLVREGQVASYAWLGRGIARALDVVGVRSCALSPDALRALHARRQTAAPDWACFGSLSPWEVLAHGRKLAGLAQIRRRQGVLLTAGILLRAPPWAALCERLGRPREDAARLLRRTISCEDRAGTTIQAPVLARALQAMLYAELSLDGVSA